MASMVLGQYSMAAAGDQITERVKKVKEWVRGWWNKKKD
jgi:hypothetical protein